MIIGLVLAPSIFWFLYLIHRDRYEKEPNKVLIKTFLLGMLSTLIAFFLEMVFDDFKGNPLYFIFVVGPAEEFAKYTVLQYYVYKQKAFDEISDGIIYASIVALGFATLENLEYVIMYGLGVLVWRSIFSILGHMIFTSYIGIALIKKKLSNNYSIFPAFLLAALLHGLFDLLLMLKSVGLVIFIPFFIYLAILYFKNLKRYTLISKLFRNNKKN